MNPLFVRQVIHGDTMTVARIELKAGCKVPEHSHHNEQIAMIQSGRVKFVLSGQEGIFSAGDTVQIPSNVPHWVEVLEDSVIVDLFSPLREDWIRGDDNYLRK